MGLENQSKETRRKERKRTKHTLEMKEYRVKPSIRL